NTLVIKNRPINPIPIINPRKFPVQKILALGTGPKIYISCNLLLGNYQRFLIGTGGDVCLINASALKPEATIDIGKARRFRGLSDSTFQTVGIVKLKILNIEVEFQVCREDLPFPGTTSFSLETKPSSSYTLPPLMKMVVAVPVHDFEKSEGYLPRMNLPDGVLGGEAVVKVEDGYATCMVINLNSNPVDIDIGPQALEEFEFSHPSSDEDDATVTERQAKWRSKLSRYKFNVVVRHKITEQYAEGLSYNTEGRPEPSGNPINNNTENNPLALPISAIPKSKGSGKKLSDSEAIQAVKCPGRPPKSKNRPRVSSAPEVRETIASRLR
ncbi:Protein of unknown function, partial [Cotesia congregata]